MMIAFLAGSVYKAHLNSFCPLPPLPVPSLDLPLIGKSCFHLSLLFPFFKILPLFFCLPPLVLLPM